jgi:mannosyltransferase OCH1-like enzyme
MFVQRKNAFLQKRRRQIYERLKIIYERIKKQREIYYTQILPQIIAFKKLNKPFELKARYNSIIPLKIYTCWHSKNIPPLMRNNLKYMQSSNPEFEVCFYDEEMCKTFITNNFNSDVLEAYNLLKPCSYKSDLWRYCVLYVNGGIYLDIKYSCINNFKLIHLTEREYFVRDREDYGTYTALIVTFPKNQIMWNCIQKIVEHVRDNYYGNNALDPTGPGLLGSFFEKEEKNNMEMHFESTNIPPYYNNLYYIMFNNSIILTYYKQYREEQSQVQKYEPYEILWNKREIYY